ncbi:hypothetical protein B0T20DRAFT_380376 [Sordaria brevicollis]|uniref:Cellobiose dehydrogenase-like cytochrome domain-containing protein n=1 Tax=Sordaria brevicollis TaxID=83679 RepID=A0AAE0PA76_SORBR|nr:hypothetical protein B0T20DRAFT_380376 [Sordaria brevicollis]
MLGLKRLAVLALCALQTSTPTVSARSLLNLRGMGMTHGDDGGALGLDKRQSLTQKYCPPSSAACFSEFTVAAQKITYRIAIPDTAAAATPFDIYLQIIAPKATAGWAGIAWGGKMSNNPLTIGWALPNGGNGSVVSSRWTGGHSLPGAYSGATYTVLPSTTANATHWQLDVHCQGCSKWANGQLNPNGANAFAWAKSTKAVANPASNSSSFSGHDGKSVWSHDLSLAKVPQSAFDALVAGKI